MVGGVQLFVIIKTDISYQSCITLNYFKKLTKCKSTQFKAECLFGEGCWNRGGRWGTRPSHFLAGQLTLSQPGGQIISTIVLQAPPDFQTLRRACLNISFCQNKIAILDDI